MDVRIIASAVATLIACNSAPLGYQGGRAPGASAAWGGPTERPCQQRSGPGDVEVDGFTLCLQSNDVVAVDDPLYVACTKDALPGGESVFYAYNGTVARAYQVSALFGRELVHDDWGTGPILVDY